MDRWSGGRCKKAWLPKLEDSGTGYGQMAKNHTGGQGPPQALVPKNKTRININFVEICTNYYGVTYYFKFATASACNRH
jgi:hypothetical protein